jgi:hypothetical protein
VLTQRQVLIALATLGLAGSLAAQQPTTVSGHVNRDDGTPLGAATVAIPALGLSTTSRSDGAYGLLVPPARIGEQVAHDVVPVMVFHHQGDLPAPA